MTSKGQATILKEVRDKLQLDTRGRVRFVETESVDIDFAKVRSAFEKECEHDGFSVPLADGLPDGRKEKIRRQWETTLPDLTGKPPAFETVWDKVERAITEPRLRSVQSEFAGAIGQ